MNTLNMMEDRMGIVRHLLDDLLDISRISEGKMTLKKETVDLVSILKSAILSTDHHRNQLHQSLLFKTPKNPIPLNGDAIRLEQVFSNLLTNASKFSPSGSTITILIHQRQTIDVEIVDEGVGLGF